MQKEFDTSDIRLSSAGERLAGIYFGKLAALDRQESLSSQQVWYAAASAAECLQLAHEDAKDLRRRGAGQDDISRIRAVGQTDSLFYVDLVSEWLQGSRLTA